MTVIADAPSMMPVQKSPWHSPVPYLFGGLAAMLGLIAFALLMLACSHWKPSGDLESGEDERDLEAGSEDTDGDLKPRPVFEQKFLVIMAGQQKPTYLATPISSRTSSFGSNSDTTNSTCSSKGTSFNSEKINEAEEELTVNAVDQLQTSTNWVNHEATDMTVST